MQLSCYFTDTAKLSSHQASTPNQPTGPGFEPKPPGKRQLNRKRKFIARVFWSKVFVSCQKIVQIVVFGFRRKFSVRPKNNFSVPSAKNSPTPEDIFSRRNHFHNFRFCFGNKRSRNNSVIIIFDTSSVFGHSSQAEILKSHHPRLEIQLLAWLIRWWALNFSFYQTA